MPRKLLCAFMAWSMASAVQAELTFEQTTQEVTPPATAEEVTVRFPFRNASKKAVKVLKMQADCTCAIPTITKKSFEPGEAGEVELNFEIGHRHGPQRRSVILSIDDPAVPVQSLVLNTVLPKVITLSVQNLLWGDNEPHQAKTVIVKTLTAGVREVRASSPNPQLQLQVESTSPTEHRILITPTPEAKDVLAMVEVEAVMAEGPAKHSTFSVRVR